MDTTPNDAAPKGINWISILGIAVLVILIFAVIWAVTIWNASKDNPIIQDAMKLEPALQEMETLTLDQIENQAASMPASQLLKDSYGFVDRFVVVEGFMSMEESMGVSQNIAYNILTEDEHYNGYILDDGLVVVDLSGNGPVPVEGGKLKAYGKVFNLKINDIWELPLIGENLKQEYANVEGMDEKVVFLIAKGVKLLDVPEKVDETTDETEVTDDAGATDDALATETEEVMDDGTEDETTDEETPAEEPVEEAHE